MSETDQDVQTLYPPREAARRLGVASSTLRRLASTYEAVHGELPWEGEESGGGRLWPTEAVERLGSARALVSAGQAKSLESALRALAGGAQPLSETLARPDAAEELTALVSSLTDQLRAIQSDLAEVPALRAELSEIPGLREEIAALRAELRARDRGAYPTLRPIAAYGGAQGSPEGERAVTADDGIKDQPGRAEADGLVVRAARWLVQRLARR